jgi:hypothetical protein
MKGGEEDMIDDQAVLVASIQGQIKEMTRTKNNLHRFAMKVNMARQQQSIGASMIAVSKALGSVTKNLQLEKASSSTRASGRANDTNKDYPRSSK